MASLNERKLWIQFNAIATKNRDFMRWKKRDDKGRPVSLIDTEQDGVKMKDFEQTNHISIPEAVMTLQYMSRDRGLFDIDDANDGAGKGKANKNTRRKYADEKAEEVMTTTDHFPKFTVFFEKIQKQSTWRRNVPEDIIRFLSSSPYLPRVSTYNTRANFDLTIRRLNNNERNSEIIRDSIGRVQVLVNALTPLFMEPVFAGTSEATATNRQESAEFHALLDGETDRRSASLYAWTSRGLIEDYDCAFLIPSAPGEALNPRNWSHISTSEPDFLSLAEHVLRTHFPDALLDSGDDSIKKSCIRFAVDRRNDISNTEHLAVL